MNHLAHFGFREEPFRMTPDRNFYYPSAKHVAVKEVMRFGLDAGEGFIIVTGEVGTGKTMLLRLLMAELPERFETALLLSPNLTPRELVLAILQDIGRDCPEPGQASMDTLVRLLNDHLYRLARSGKRLVIVIDEAQNLPGQGLEQLRLLSNFESDTRKLLQIVLVGQPELAERLRRPGLRQLRQRVTILETLPPLDRTEMDQYVHFRISRAGGRRTLRLGRSCLSLLWRYSRGNPRLINKALHRALLVAYGQQKKTIDRAALKEALATLDNTTPVASWPRRALLVASVAAIIGLACYLLAGRPSPAPWLASLPWR